MCNIQYGKAGLILTSWQAKAAKTLLLPQDIISAFPQNSVEPGKHLRKPLHPPTVSLLWCLQSMTYLRSLLTTLLCSHGLSFKQRENTVIKTLSSHEISISLQERLYEIWTLSKPCSRSGVTLEHLSSDLSVLVEYFMLTQTTYVMYLPPFSLLNWFLWSVEQRYKRKLICCTWMSFTVFKVFPRSYSEKAWR